MIVPAPHSQQWHDTQALLVTARSTPLHFTIVLDVVGALCKCHFGITAVLGSVFHEISYNSFHSDSFLILQQAFQRTITKATVCTKFVHNSQCIKNEYVRAALYNNVSIKTCQTILEKNVIIMLRTLKFCCGIKNL